MSPHSRSKLYISRGIQTDNDLSRQPPRCHPQCLSSLDCITAQEFALPSADFSPKSIRSQILDTFAHEGAYTCSQVSDFPERPFSSSFKNQKYAGLDSHRPSNHHLAPKRILSLPGPSVHDVKFLERNQRIVSMPEFTRFQLLELSNNLHKSQGSSSFSSDASRISPEPDGQQWPLIGHNKMYPLSIPQTPSPPSSPESVVIIGNEPRVSGAFLRRSCSDDDNGWVTWASSPPRPIPALHGPLSLPYARCPSGAEGTVIEGDDLSHKIWGLGTGDTQNNAHTSGKAEIQNQEPKTFAMHTKIPCHDTRQLAFQHPRLSDDVIDLSTIPSAAYSGYQTAPATFERYLASSRISHPCFQPGLGHRGEHSNSNDSKITTGVLFSQRVANLCTKRYYYDSADIVENSRSGLDLSKPTTDKATSQFVGSTQRRLNRAAPAFIPSMGWSSNESHIMQKENDPSTLNHQFMRRVELSQQCAIELPTPPSTSSPRWSPVFSHPIDIELSRGACGDPKIYSPQPDLDDYSNKLMSMIQQIKQQDLMNSSKRHSLDVARQTREPLVQKGLVASTANKYHQERFQEDPGRTNVSQPPLDIRRNLSQQNPRSIPLTRLIQRRLSSVPEETNGPTQVQTIRPRVSLEPLIYISATEQLTRGTVTSTAPSVQSSTETVDVQPEEQNPNAIVKLPHRRVGLRAARTLSGPSSKARAGGVSKKEKEEIINGENDKPNSEITPEKGRAGQMKKSKVNEDNKHKHCTQ